MMNFYIVEIRSIKHHRAERAFIVNGESVAQFPLQADGSIQTIRAKHHLTRSSWVAWRILGAAHSNPAFANRGGQPIRASLASADWCLKAVDQCWSQKKSSYAKAEMADAEAAYAHARQAYRRIREEIGQSSD